MSQHYLAAIEELINENQTIKSENKKIVLLCQDILDNVVNLFKKFFPNIPAYDSLSIFQAGQQICEYYIKQLTIVQTEVVNSILQVFNMFNIQEEEELENMAFDNLKNIIDLIKVPKNGILKQLNQCKQRIIEFQEFKEGLEKALNIKQLQLKRLEIQLIQKQSTIEKVLNSNQLLILQQQNLGKRFARIADELKNAQMQYGIASTQLVELRTTNQSLRRQIINTQRQKIDSKYSLEEVSRQA